MSTGNKINKPHRHCNTVHEYLSVILEEKYIYTIEKIANLLDMRQPYIQNNFINKLDTLEIDIDNKGLIKEALRWYYNTPFIFMPEPTYDLLKQFAKYQSILRKRILIKESSVINLIYDIFKMEVKIKGEDGKIIKTNIPLTDDIVYLIFNNRLYGTKALKEYLGLEHDTQLYRKLNNTLHIKLVCEDPSNKNNRVRYILL